MNCLCQLFDNDNIGWILVIALIIIWASYCNGSGCGCGR